MGKSLINKNIASGFQLDTPYHSYTAVSANSKQYLLFSKCYNEWDNIILHMYYLDGFRKIILPKNTEIITTLVTGRRNDNTLRKNFIKFFRDEQGNIYYTLFPAYGSSAGTTVHFSILGGYNN